MTEIGDLSVQIRESPILGDTADETNSAWSVDLIGVSGRTCQICWCTLRRWAGLKVSELALARTLWFAAALAGSGDWLGKSDDEGWGIAGGVRLRRVGASRE
jgi:hypothetical protein